MTGLRVNCTGRTALGWWSRAFLGVMESEPWAAKMDANSSKPSQTCMSQVSALRVLQQWLRDEGGRGRIPTAVGALLEASITASERGEPLPWKDGESLHEVWRIAKGHAGESGSAQPRGSEFTRWWQAREAHIRQVCRDQGCAWSPELVVKTGGGREIPTVYGFQLHPLVAELGGDEQPGKAEEVPSPDGGLVYRVAPAKPALVLRMLVGSKPFLIRSWRGWLLLASVVINILLIGGIWWSLLRVWTPSRPVTTGHIVLVVMAAVVSWGLWRLMRPIVLLPIRRVTIAHEGLLSWNTLHGQLRTMHDGESRLGGRTFSIVRHWGPCPVCAADVELSEGGREFPDRVIGRCNDAPTEHVFSFDPVRLVGVPLRSGGQ